MPKNFTDWTGTNKNKSDWTKTSKNTQPWAVLLGIFFFFLLQSGSFLLQESGSKLLLESSNYKSRTAWNKTSKDTTDWGATSKNRTQWKPEDIDISAGFVLLQNGDKVLLENSERLKLE